MKTTFVLTVLFASLFTIGCHAQDIKLLNATQQEWSGGVAGRYGTNYNIEIQISDYSIVPDTVWVKGIPYEIDFSNANTGCSKSVDKVHHTIKYLISASEQHDESNETPDKLLTPQPEKKLTKQVNGVALVTYVYKGKQHSLTIKQFKSLEPVAYP